MTDEIASRLAVVIAEHQARNCYCRACAEARADLALNSRDQSGRVVERIRK